ncbi:hypothetical protein RFI_08389 [Reticulomyxa filosa]|uniref:B9 domain-containing protein 2 n=1 Tax=Reticulomyxa filosa TaxID=46433 RepID=X6NSK4_RETFI|nr:hypothetical protein RFI_08389 [Reticulomyxa filosa]|eukprot:ETO28739.1 hypothetical protein RFI_08389 [Reticulomyxa filosa]
MSNKAPELHIIGEIVSGSNDLSTNCNCFCKYNITTGNEWECVSGSSKGQTQADYPSQSYWSFFNRLFNLPTLPYVWNHPIDVHYFMKTIHGWPKIVFEIGDIDSSGKKQISCLPLKMKDGYGVCFIPYSVGAHQIEVPIWRVVGTFEQEAHGKVTFFLENFTPLKAENFTIAFFLSNKPQKKGVANNPNWINFYSIDDNSTKFSEVRFNLSGVSYFLLFNQNSLSRIYFINYIYTLKSSSIRIFLKVHSFGKPILKYFLILMKRV